MDGFNKVISFVLGLVVVVVLIAVVTGRLNLQNRFLGGVSRGQTTTSPTPSITATPTPSGIQPTPTIYFSSTQSKGGTQSIPKTGSETYLLFTAALSLIIGMTIKRSCAKSR